MAWPLLKILALLTEISIECLDLQSDTLTVFSLNHIGSGHELRSGLAQVSLLSHFNSIPRPCMLLHKLGEKLLATNYIY